MLAHFKKRIKSDNSYENGDENKISILDKLSQLIPLSHDLRPSKPKLNGCKGRWKKTDKKMEEKTVRVKLAKLRGVYSDKMSSGPESFEDVTLEKEDMCGSCLTIDIDHVDESEVKMADNDAKEMSEDVISLKNNGKRGFVLEQEIETIGAKLGMSKEVNSQVLQIYKDATRKLRLRVFGKKRNSLMAACFFIAGRVNEVPRTMNEITKLTQNKQKDVAYYYWVIVKSTDFKFPVCKPSDYIRRICSNLRLNDSQIEKSAETAAMRASQITTLNGRRPASIAAAVIYLSIRVHGFKVTLDEVGTASSVSPQTTKFLYLILIEHLDLVWPDLANPGYKEKMKNWLLNTETLS